MTTQHTPGPWHHDFDTINGHFFVYDNDARMYVLVRPRGNRERDEIEANARLIAAAPDLLEALQALTAAFDSVMAHYADQMPQADRISRGMDLGVAESAIAKAVGE